MLKFLKMNAKHTFFSAVVKSVPYIKGNYLFQLKTSYNTR